MSYLMEDLKDARAAALLLAIVKFDREYITEYGTLSVFSNAFFQIEPGGILLLKMPKVYIRLSFGFKNVIYCHMELANGEGLIRSSVEVRDLDELADWLELQGDPVE
jgi:hypothetical protein